MKLIIGSISAFALLPLLSGCTNFGRLDIPYETKGGNGVPHLSVSSITQRIRCELAPLADPNRVPNLTQGDWYVAVQLTLDVTDDGNLAPSFNYLDGSFGFNAGTKLEVSRQHDVVIDLLYSIQGIKSAIAAEKRRKEAGHLGSDDPSVYACPSVVDTNLAGELSITESADLAIRTGEVNQDVTLGANSGIFGGFIQFIVTKNLNTVGPTWSLRHFKGPGGFAGFSEVNTDKLVFAFGEMKPKSSKIDQSATIQALRGYINTININELTVNFSNGQSISR